MADQRFDRAIMALHRFEDSVASVDRPSRRRSAPVPARNWKEDAGPWSSSASRSRLCGGERRRRERMQDVTNGGEPLTVVRTIRHASSCPRRDSGPESSINGSIPTARRRSYAGREGECAGSGGHENPANRDDLPTTSDRAWTRVPVLVFTQCPSGVGDARPHSARFERQDFGKQRSSS